MYEIDYNVYPSEQQAVPLMWKTFVIVALLLFIYYHKYIIMILSTEYDICE